MITDVTVDLSNVNLMPATEVEEIIQNVQMVVATMKGTCPMDRSFGVDGKFVDEPINAAQAKAVAEITSAVNSQEPRARVKKVFFNGEISGNTAITVRVEIVESKLRNSMTL